MCDEVTASRRRSGRTPRVAALSASTAAPARTRPPSVSATTSAPVAQRAHARVLEDAHAALEQAVAQPEREPRRLHRRVAGREHRAAEPRRVAAGGRRGAVEVGELRRRPGGARGLEQPVEHGVLGLRGGGEHEPRRLNHASTPSASHQAPIARDALRRRARGGERALRAEALDQVGQVRPQRLGEAAVATARPVAADAGLEQHDAGAAPAQLPRGPHPRVAAAEHDDVGARSPRSGGTGSTGPASSSQ